MDQNVIIVVVIVVVIVVMVIMRRKTQIDSKKLKTIKNSSSILNTYEPESTEVKQSEYIGTVNEPSLPEPTPEAIRGESEELEKLKMLGDTVVDLSKNPIFWAAVLANPVTVRVLTSSIKALTKKVAPKFFNRVAVSLVGKMTAKLTAKITTTVVGKSAALAAKLGISLAKAATIVGAVLVVFDLFTIALDIGDAAGTGGPGYVRMGSNKVYLGMRDESLKKLKEDLEKKGSPYPLYLSDVDNVSVADVNAIAASIISDIFDADRVPIHPLAENMFTTVKNDIVSGKLTLADTEDESVMEKYDGLVDEKSVEVEILRVICEKYAGKIVNGQCSYTSKEQCEKWPVKDDENYGEWKDDACVLADPSLRKTCEDNKIEYDVNTGSCKVDVDYCLRKGADWKDNDCYVSPGQEFGEFILGTTVTRGLRQIFDPKMYESCKDGEVDDGYFCRKLTCPDDKPEEFAGSCYPRCNSGYQGAGPLCWESCPEGYVDDAAFCRKPINTVIKSSYMAKKKPCAEGLRDDGTSCWDDLKCNTVDNGFYNKTWGSVNCQANMCIDLDGGKTDNGTKVQLWDCDSNNQNQKLTYDAGTGELKFNKTGKCLEISANSKDNWAQAQQWDCIGSESQKWDRDGEQFRNRNSGKCLNVRNGEAFNGNWLQQYDCNENDPSNKWEEHNEGGGKFYKSRITTKPFRTEGYGDCYSTWIAKLETTCTGTGGIKTPVFEREYCDDGDRLIAGVCWKGTRACPEGYVDNGELCSTGGEVISKKSYGRGIGRVTDIQSRVKQRKIDYSTKDN
jgi:hypothetical protein